jgi:hypothetical protein
MKRFLLGALAMGVIAVLTSFALSHSTATDEPRGCPSRSTVVDQDPTPRPGPTTTTVSYLHEPGNHAAFVWEWKGNDIVAATSYYFGSDGVTKRRALVVEEKK